MSATVEGGQRQLPTDQKGLSRGILDVFCSCPMVRLVALGIRSDSGTIHSRNFQRELCEGCGKRGGRSRKNGSRHEWARVADLEMELDGKKIAQYRATTKDLLRH